MRTFRLKQNKKGVSPIIATLLLIVIAVAAAVVVYAFVSGFIGQTTTTTHAQGTLEVQAISVNSTGIYAYVQNTGSQTETFNAAYVDNTLISTTNIGLLTPLSPQQTALICINGTTWANGISHDVKIICNDGTSVVTNAVS